MLLLASAHDNILVYPCQCFEAHMEGRDEKVETRTRASVKFISTGGGNIHWHSAFQQSWPSTAHTLERCWIFYFSRYVMTWAVEGSSYRCGIAKLQTSRLVVKHLPPSLMKSFWALVKRITLPRRSGDSVTTLGWDRRDTGNNSESFVYAPSLFCLLVSGLF